MDSTNVKRDMTRAIMAGIKVLQETKSTNGADLEASANLFELLMNFKEQLNKIAVPMHTLAEPRKSARQPKGLSLVPEEDTLHLRHLAKSTSREEVIAFVDHKMRVGIDYWRARTREELIDYVIGALERRPASPGHPG